MNYSNKSFIEVQFPVSKVSKESYKERKANLGQTLTGLGKWWGRKPLTLVRAAILGLLMPASTNPKKDREIFLKILTMDNEGLLLRKSKNLTIKEIYNLLTAVEKVTYFINDSTKDKPVYKKEVSSEEKDQIQKLVFNRLSYDDKIVYCDRVEHVKSLPEAEWQVINEHLGTKAKCLQELIEEIGIERFGHIPKIGDCFAGGGSIPFEAARMGADVYASDLNPIAALLTWAALNIAGTTDEEIKKLREFQKIVYDEVDGQVKEWGIEHNEKGDRSDAYIYCNESKCLECGYRVPLAPSWIIGKGSKTVALLNDNGIDGFYIEIVQGANNEQIKQAELQATVKDNKMHCPHCGKETPIAVLRGERKDAEGNTLSGLRKWEKHEFIPREDDIFQERLYCVRYEHKYLDENGNLKSQRYYTAPNDKDLEREKKVLELLAERFNEWQEKGFIPSSMIESGEKTDEPVRTRGWQYWHHLFNPRQLLTHGLFLYTVLKMSENYKEKVIGLLGLNKLCNWNSKLAFWDSSSGCEKGAQVFNNQALNTLYNYLSRTLISLDTTWFFNINNSLVKSKPKLTLKDARKVDKMCDCWITDPPYADAVNYHELTEYFIAWDKKMLEKIFPNITSEAWYTDSKRVLAIKGTDQIFNESMIEVYKNLAENMPNNGMQIVMFTHQSVSVWAELALILWASGLSVSAAWNIATETEANGLREGNYVKGTVLLVLRKQSSENTAYLDELYPEIEIEVKNQIDSMKELDNKEDPNFSDADYLLAAYAASLKVLTFYKQIEDIDVSYELSKTRFSNEVSPIANIINEAVKIAYDYLIPANFDTFTWKLLIPEERFYIKGIDLEKANIYQVSAYQELARGFGVKEYKDLLYSTKANQARLKSALEFSMRGMGENDKFGSSLLRNILAALNQSIKEEDTSVGRNWLKNELQNYWTMRTTIVEILDYIATLGHIENMPHWEKEAYYATMLRERVKDDSI